MTYWSRLLHDPRCRYRRVRRRRGHRRSASPVRPPCTAWQCAEGPVPAESVSVPTAGRARRSSGPGSVREVVSHVQKLLLTYIGEMCGGDADEKNRCGVEGPVRLGHVVVEHADDCFSQKRCRADEGGGSGPQHGGRHGRRQGQEGVGDAHISRCHNAWHRDRHDEHQDQCCAPSGPTRPWLSICRPVDRKGAPFPPHASTAGDHIHRSRPSSFAAVYGAVADMRRRCRQRGWTAWHVLAVTRRSAFGFRGDLGAGRGGAQ